MASIMQTHCTVWRTGSPKQSGSSVTGRQQDEREYDFQQGVQHALQGAGAAIAHPAPGQVRIDQPRVYCRQEWGLGMWRCTSLS